MAFNTIFTPSSAANTDASRIMVSKKKSAGPGFDIDEVSRLCESFGRLAKPVHQPKRMPFSCFVEFDSPSAAIKALCEIPKGGRYMAFPATPKNDKNGDANYSATTATVSNHFQSNGGGEDWRSGRMEITSTSNPPTQQVGMGRCICCQNFGPYKCERCLDPYCSPECQRAHWPIHKKECIPMPNLVKVVGSVVTNTTPIVSPSNKLPLRRTEAPPKAPLKSVGYDSHGRELLALPNKDSPPSKPNNSFQRTSHNRSRNHDDHLDESMTTQNAPPFGCDPPESGSTVAITAIVSTNNVFVRSLAQKEDQLYINLLKDVNNYARNSESLREMPLQGDIVAAEFDGDFYRALVHDSRSENRIVVVFLEFGNFETKHLADLRFLSEDLQHRPRYVRRFILKNVSFIKEGHQTVNAYLKQFELDVTPLIIVYTGSWSRLSNGELIVKSTNELINETLRQIISGESNLNTAKTTNTPQTAPENAKALKQPEAEREIFTEEHLKRSPLTSLDSAKIVVLDNENIDVGVLAITLASGREVIDAINRAANSYIKQSEDGVEYRPRKDELCLAQVNSIWHRAVCEGFNGRNVNLRLVDIGLLAANVSIEHVRKCPSVMLDYPCVTDYAEIQGIDKSESGDTLPDKLVNRLKTIFEIDSEHEVKKISYSEDEELYIIHVPKLINKLREDGLI